MGTGRSLRWQKLLWAFVVLFALTLFLYMRYARGQNIIAFSILPYFVWPYAAVLTIIVVIFRVVRKVISKEAFLYILMGGLNLCLGIIGEYLVIISKEYLPLGIRVMFLANILTAAIIFLDVFGD